MSDEMEVIRGSGHLFRDLGYPDADVEHLKSALAARIIGVLDARQMTVRAAEQASGVAAADFSRIRRAKLDRFTIDRLIRILNRLSLHVDVEVEISDMEPVTHSKVA
jgi:predicted XRE-type DNA-binding protein